MLLFLYAILNTWTHVILHPVLHTLYVDTHSRMLSWQKDLQPFIHTGEPNERTKLNLLIQQYSIKHTKSGQNFLQYQVCELA